MLGGASHGAVAWGAYFTVEHALYAVGTLASTGNGTISPAQWRTTGAVGLAFLCIGLILGALGGLAILVVSRGGTCKVACSWAMRLRAAAVLTVVLAFAANAALARPFGKVEAVELGVSGVLAAALASGLFRACSAGKADFLSNPWVASLLLVGVGWMGRLVLDGQSLLLKTAGALAMLLATVLVALAGSRAWKRHHVPVDSFCAARAAAVLIAVAAIAFAGIRAMSRGVPALPPLASHADPGRPNVVLVTMDTVRADHLSLYGYPQDTSPSLTEFARGATVYDEAISASDHTLASHASLFTGLPASWHGAHILPVSQGRGRPLGTRCRTLAEMLSANGYRTIGVVANFSFLSPAFGMNRGFQAYDWRVPVNFDASGRLLRSGVRALLEPQTFRRDRDLRIRRAGEITAESAGLLNRVVHEPTPFFLFVNYLDAHALYLPPAPFSDRFRGRGRYTSLAEYEALESAVLGGERTITSAQQEHLVSQYDGAVAYIDSNVGRLLSCLRDLGLYQNTLIVITSDHGETFGARGLIQHGVSVYQDQVHVPLIVKFPGQVEPRVVLGTVSHLDVLSTVLRALGMRAPDVAQGVALQDEASAVRQVVVAESFSRGKEFKGRLDRVERALYEGNLKLVWSSRGRREIYDLASDPAEAHSEFRPDDPESRRLLARLDAWIGAIPPYSADTFKLDEDTLKRLRSLGYM